MSRAGKPVDRLPPYSEEAERCILGSMMLSPTETMDRAIEVLRENEAFYVAKHQTIFAALCSMWAKRDAIDVLLVGEKLRNRGQFEEVGGFSYLTSLVEAVPSAASLDYYLEIVAAKYTLRRMIAVATRITAAAYEVPDDIGDFVDKAEAEILNVQRDSGMTGNTVRSADAIGLELVEQYEQEFAGTKVRLATGFSQFDSMVSIEPGMMVVVAARPSVGKSALGAQIARQVAQAGSPVAVFTLEMTDTGWGRRIVNQIGQRNFRGSAMTHDDFVRLTTSVAAFRQLPIHMDQTGWLSIMALRSRLRRLVHEKGVKLCIVDYLQLLSGVGHYANREAEVSDVSRKLKITAKELNIPIIVLAQLNRESDRGTKPRMPRMSDLRESGSIEQDADVIVLLHREDEVADDPDKEPVRIIVDKQRDGKTGGIHTIFRKPVSTFDEVAPHEWAGQQQPGQPAMPTNEELGL